MSFTFTAGASGVKSPVALLQSDAVTEHAQAVVIGGGVGGASIAYHLTAKGWRDVVVVERAELTSGSTFHSAGLVGQLRSSVALTRLMMWSVECYRRLAAETGRDPGWRETGSLRLACTPERVLEHRRQTGWAKTFGLPLEEIGPAEAQRLFPVMGLEGCSAPCTCRRTGTSTRAASRWRWPRARGGAERRSAPAPACSASRVRDGRVREVETTAGTIRTDVVVNAGGMYAPEIGRMVGVTIPLVPMAHQYLVTKPIDGVHPAIPMLRDPDHLVYFREEVGGLVAGGYERAPAPWGLDGIPADFNHQLLPPDWERFAPLMEGAVHRVPGDRERRDRAADQRPRGLHAGRRVHPRASRRTSAASSWRAASAPTASRAPAAWAGSWPTGSWRATRASTSGTWTSAGSAPSIARGASP